MAAIAQSRHHALVSDCVIVAGTVLQELVFNRRAHPRKERKWAKLYGDVELRMGGPNLSYSLVDEVVSEINVVRIIRRWTGGRFKSLAGL